MAFAGFYEFVLPARASSEYLAKLDSSGRQVEASFKTLAKTTNLDVFNNPDVTTQKAQQNLSDINADIKDCQAKLAAFGKVAGGIDRPPFTGYTSSLHDAEVQREHARTIIAQSDDVLAQYRQLSDFLNTYYGYDATFTAYTSAVNQVSNLDSLAPYTPRLDDQASQLHQMSQALAALKAPSGYEQITTAAPPVYQQASEGFSELSTSLKIGDDNGKDAGIGLVEAAVNTHDSSLVDLPSDLSQKSYLIVQVTELPDKIENLFST